MGVCAICGRMSASEGGHTDCIQRRRIELEDEEARAGLAERIALADGPGGLGVEVRAILEHLARNRDG